MREKDLLIKLNTLKEVKPSEDWKKQNRDLLLTQIYAGQERKEDGFSFFSYKLPFEILSTARPAMVLAFIMFLFLGSGAWSMKLAQDTKPGDSLYTAKRIGEHTQLALTFDEKEKVKLQLDFAANRANELSEVLAEPNGDKVAKVEQLVNDFNKQITQAKTALVKINPDTAKSAETTAPTKPEEDAMFSANLSKDNNGLSYAEGEKPNDNRTTPAEETVTETPTSTPAQAENASSTTSSNLDTSETQAILEQAKELLNNDDVSATLDKIDQASQTVNGAPTGQVKGEEESATTTVEKK